MSVPAPYRLVLLLVGGWACDRAVALLPGGGSEAPRPLPAAMVAERRVVADAPLGIRPAYPSVQQPFTAVTLPLQGAAGPRLHGPPASSRDLPLATPTIFLSTTPAETVRGVAGGAMESAAGGPDGGHLTFPEQASQPRVSRWSGYAYAFARSGGGGAALAHSGSLGGSQFGARVSYRLNGDATRPLAASVRVTGPLRAGAAEAAVGLDWRPSARLPIHLVAERRQALGAEGRSAFAVGAHGGVERDVAGLRVEAYAQAGLVGLRARDPFVDAAARASLPAGRLRVGAGLWGAAQPGAARLDVGPQASVTLPSLGGRSMTLQADWRLRAAGDAAPGSGPSLTLSTAF